MNISSTSNQDENSVTVLRENGTRIDFCYMTKLDEVVIGETSGDTGDDHIQIVLSIPEARELQKHLTTVLG